MKLATYVKSGMRERIVEIHSNFPTAFLIILSTKTSTYLYPITTNDYFIIVIMLFFVLYRRKSRTEAENDLQLLQDLIFFPSVALMPFCRFFIVKTHTLNWHQGANHGKFFLHIYIILNQWPLCFF